MFLCYCLNWLPFCYFKIVIFPIGDDQVKGGHYPIVSYALLAANVLVFFYQLSLGTALDAFFMEYGSIPVEILNGEDYFTLFTSIFMHGGWMHLLGNMAFLFVFADNIESTIGSPKFLFFYILGGLFATAAHIFFNMGSSIPSIGASGAISAVLGAYLVMFPTSKIKVLVLIFFRSFHMAAIWFLGLWIGQQLLSGIGSLGPATANSAGVAWWAHIGGFFFGIIGGFLFRKTIPQLPLVDNSQQSRQRAFQSPRPQAPRNQRYPKYLWFCADPFN